MNRIWGKILAVNRKKTIRSTQVRVAVGISGGVDSAVSALLLKKAGYDVVGVHLYCWPPKSEVEKDGMTRDEWIKKNGCRADEDRQMALKTALELEIPFKVLDFSEEYNQRVIKYFYEEYEAGRTPNPDVLCNSEIKFGLFLEWAMANGFDYIATGHYAKLLSVSSRAKTVLGSPWSTGSRLRAVLASASAADEVSLNIPKDKHKDQTYFLWKLTQKELSRVLFPLGDYVKTEVRAMAKEEMLSVADRKDSQGICFIGNVEVKNFLARRLKKKRGMVLDTEGQVLGTHDGVWFYTVGQRGGWVMDPRTQGIKNSRTQDGETPIYYVISKDAKRNELVVAEAEGAMGDQLEVGSVNQISNTKWDMNDLLVRIRHGGELIGARGMENEDGLLVILDKPIRGIASGQSAVFYSSGGECLGGGVIL
ncbi:TPA: tRNA 2-thiouridine(34) synthase MnmA [Candidatus Collierbacteria bacterium]|uniref:tRNA-specific 2-thiouridylase MnmA n=1 Tax=Candidatus Collierbacteria bacterium GW2011_GWB2_44_22 TaxID=1618387 RepID=A0A0G1HVK0_9BACT|nr:MAG: tRNA-specific 2-thiouridylase MnmA [Candidatus Collierbacteria bacterium GW2011_GWA2_44_13]KKT51096.1 MAG: tRNA-specific 2-thiouridylase MnmA [Candidatus Collierbacteria bacterium GW2011_GWB2_44_22]KKT61974.1 MAG: tRNA-specific 2-thiouridylase MnmA [Candidatus Collierbacteria bacterium GW2011_GWD1_44_27]KKT65597.1 MAG: tRNA-specific 2-thiouridylase MnmA [Candidatus Collierbacteria bacterium GW2011_GWC2_44_30]KKT68177.1 MAG: 5-methylaminomethyl-2-thiouridylate-methyltransferase, tRNA-spe